MNQNETIRFFSIRFMPFLLVVLMGFVMLFSIFINMQTKHLDALDETRVTQFEKVMNDCMLYDSKVTKWPKSVVYLAPNGLYVRSHDKDVLQEAYDFTWYNKKSPRIFRVFHYCSN